jgi:hypothetical protein
MSKPTTPAADAAIPPKGQPKPSPYSRSLLAVLDEIDDIRSLIECAWMAGASLLKNECDAIQTVLRDAERRLADVKGKIESNIARGDAPAEGHADD